MKMYQATPGRFIPEGETLASMYPGDAMADQMAEVCGGSAMGLADDTDKMSMGEYEEHYALCNPPPPKPTATVWVTREGQQIAVAAMGDQHIINTIRYIRRRASNKLMTLAIGMSDAAEMAIGTEFDDFDATDDDYVASTCPTFPALLAEAEKRGLEL